MKDGHLPTHSKKGLWIRVIRLACLGSRLGLAWLFGTPHPAEVTSTEPSIPVLPQPRRTGPLIWFTAIVCAVLAVAVIVAAAVVLSVYLAYRPRAPFVRVAGAHLHRLGYAQYGGLLDVVMAIDMEAANRNARTAASFSDAEFDLLFDRAPIARLRAADFDVPENSTLPLHYLVQSSGAPLGEDRIEKVWEGVRRGRVEFQLRGQARTRWTVGDLLTLSLWTHLDCNLHYFYPNGTTLALDCTSKSHYNIIYVR